ncbi:MAG: ABC transporter permease subunit [Nitrospirae bacterium]|nr:MAG: ABC transporter permease subunit [Nitrospirota bacterium]
MSSPETSAASSPSSGFLSSHAFEQSARQHAAQRRVRKWLDRLARFAVSLGGMATIVSVIGILVFLVMEMLPLFFAPTLTLTQSLSIDPPAASPRSVAGGIDQYREVAYVFDRGTLSFYRMATGESLEFDTSALPPADAVAALARASGPEYRTRYGLAGRDGRIWPVSVQLTPVYRDDRRTVMPGVEVADAFPAIPLSSRQHPSPPQIVNLAYQALADGHVTAALLSSGEVWVTRAEESGGLLSEGELEIVHGQIPALPQAPITSLCLDSMGESLVLGTDNGILQHWDIRDAAQPALGGTYATGQGSSVTALRYLIGDRTLVVGTADGNVTTWMLMRDHSRPGGVRLEPVRTFMPHQAAVTHIVASDRDKGFITGDEAGGVLLHHSTSHQTLLQLPPTGHPTAALDFAPKADGILQVDRTGTLRSFALHNPHPEITFATLFLPVLYEGYERPEHIWQSSSGSDDFEPKFGLMPLIFGTLKGTIYAMLFAVPFAVAGAIYTSMFMHPNLRATVKPVLEIMAALPSVVLGFLAGLWLAPLLAQIFPAVVGMMVFMPLAVLAAALCWQWLPVTVKNRGNRGLELAALALVLGSVIAVCLALNTPLECWWFGCDFKRWLNDVLGLPYDQRNALVIGFAMGFAVIPIIFSISEDSLSNVPKHLIAGSLALGATPWQTLTRLVLVSASPGIFSAIMIGFGRAIGETMIVLMATGNTPIMEWNLFNGFRTLSANIAVEMPEAPHGGTLYRVLFLSAVLLFVFTFVINTGAEIIRQRLRAKYSQY